MSRDGNAQTESLKMSLKHSINLFYLGHRAMRWVFNVFVNIFLMLWNGMNVWRLPHLTLQLSKLVTGSELRVCKETSRDRGSCYWRKWLSDSACKNRNGNITVHRVKLGIQKSTPVAFMDQRACCDLLYVCPDYDEMSKLLKCLPSHRSIIHPFGKRTIESRLCQPDFFSNAQIQTFYSPVVVAQFLTHLLHNLIVTGSGLGKG